MATERGSQSEWPGWLAIEPGVVMRCFWDHATRSQITRHTALSIIHAGDRVPTECMGNLTTGR